MCGIMGFVATEGWKEPTSKSPGTAEFLAALMATIEVRGEHASGIGFMRRNSTKVSFAKRPIPSSHFLATHDWTTMVKYQPDLMIGHARFATHGSAKNPINNHPHVSASRRYALVHNGVISDGANIKTEGWCDSERILALMVKGGVEKTAHLMESTFNASSYAVLALDAKTHYLWVFRNSKSPCVVADMTDTIGGIVFCSTLSIFEDAMELTDLEESPVVYEVKAGSPYYFPSPCRPGLEHLKFSEASYATTTTTFTSDDSDLSAWEYGYTYSGRRKAYMNYGGSGPAKESISSNKERRERLRQLALDETPLDFKLTRDGKEYKTWKEYFKDYPATFEEMEKEIVNG